VIKFNSREKQRRIHACYGINPRKTNCKDRKKEKKGKINQTGKKNSKRNKKMKRDRV
jgi:hypothetical protein